LKKWGFVYQDVIPTCKELFGSMESIGGDEKYREPPKSFTSPIKMGWEVSFM
jgi:hypothetical protein